MTALGMGSGSAKGTWRLLAPGWSSEMPSNVRSCFTVRAGGAGW